MEVLPPESAPPSTEHEVATTRQTYDSGASLDAYTVQLHNLQSALATSDPERREAARRAFARAFPLDEANWSSWVMDAPTPETKLEILELALKDYLSPVLWAEWAKAKAAAARDVAEARKAFAEAAGRAGQHCTRGRLIFEAWRGFELKEQSVSGDATQLEALEKRFATTPIEGSDEAWARYLALRPQPPSETVRSRRETTALMGDRAQHEAAIENYRGNHPENPGSGETAALPELESAWLEYLRVELEARPSKTPFILFERAIGDCCLSHRIWTLYVSRCEVVNFVPERILDLCARAVRNVPGCAALWAAHVRALERFGASSSEIHDCSQRAFSCLLGDAWYEVGACELAAARRRDADPQPLLEAFVSRLGSIGGDAYVAGLRLQARWARARGDTRACAAALSEAHAYRPYSLDLLRERLDGERRGPLAEEDAIAARRTLASTFNKTKARDLSVVSRIGSYWLEFELDHGDLRQFVHALDQVESAAAALSGVAPRCFTPCDVATVVVAEPAGRHRSNASSRSHRVTGTDPSEKRQASSASADKSESSLKRPRSESAVVVEGAPASTAAPKSRRRPKGVSAGVEVVEDPAAEAEPSLDSAGTASEPTRSPQPQRDDGNTLYISHLPLGVKELQLANALVPLLSARGCTMSNARILPTKSGTSAYAYVDVDGPNESVKQEAVQACVQAAELKVLGQAIRIQISKPPKPTPAPVPQPIPAAVALMRFVPRNVKR